MTEREDPREDFTSAPSSGLALRRGFTLPRTSYSRREVLKAMGLGVGALSIGAILASCNAQAGVEHDPAADAALFREPATAELNFANWPLYIDRKKVDGVPTYPTLNEFQEATEATVNYRDVINSNPEFFGKIQPLLQNGQYCGYDIIVITNGDTLNALMRLDYLVRLPRDMRPNFDRYAGPSVKDPQYDPGNRYTMAWQSGFTGIGWDPAQVEQLRPDNPTITKASDLFDPAFKGKVGMFADNADLPSMAMLALGVDPSTSTEDDWREAADLLQRQRDDGIVRQYYTQDYTNALQNGDVALTMGWSGDIYQLNAEGDVSGLQFCVPEEGVIIWTDNMVIPVGVQNPVNAINFMDFVYDPSVQAQITEYVNYLCPVPKSQPIIAESDEVLATSPLVFPTKDDLARAYTYYVFTSPEQQQYWNSLFNPIYQG